MKSSPQQNGLRSKPKPSFARSHRRAFRDAWKQLMDMSFPVGGVGTPVYMDLLAELAEVDAFLFTWLNRIDDHSESEIAAELSKIIDLENRARVAMGADAEPAKWQNLLQYVSVMRDTLVATGVPKSEA